MPLDYISVDHLNNMLMRPITSEKLELFASVFPPPYDSEYARY
jgi:hypothetical protein